MDEITVQEQMACARALGVVEAAGVGLEMLLAVLPESMIGSVEQVIEWLGGLEIELREAGDIPDDGGEIILVGGGRE